MSNIFNRLKNDFTAKQEDEYISLTLPVVTWINNGLFELKIKQYDGGFTIYMPTDLFYDANNSQTYYFNLFEKNNKNYHYDIQIKDDIFYKEYSEDRNIVVAIDEFVKFYVMLENFILGKEVIGHEEDFE